MHRCGMRDHQTIMAAIGADKAAEALGLPLSTTRSWERRKSIPARYWQAFTKRRWAMLSELAAAPAIEAERAA